MFQSYLAAFTTLDKLRHICPHSGMIWQIQAHSESWHSWTYSCMYIKAYSETMAYSSILRTVEIFSQFQTLLKINSCIFWTLFEQIEIYLELWLIYARNVLRIFRYIHKVTHIGISLPTLGFRCIQSPGITGSNGVKQHLLFKSGSSFKSLFRSIWNIC